MSFELLLAIGLTCMAIYLASVFYLGVRIDNKQVETNLLIILILLCPIINTLVAVYLLHKNSDYKKSLEKLFND